MNTWKAIIAALVIFGAGLVTGGIWTRMAVADSSKNPVVAATQRSTTPRAQPLSLEHLRKMDLMMRVQKDLNLTPEQHERIEKVISDGQEHVRDLWSQVEPDIHDELQAVKDKLASELTPEQKQLFDDLMKQRLHHGPSTNAPPILSNGK